MFSQIRASIVLCKQKNKALVEITLPKDANIHAREYQLYLPSKVLRQIFTTAVDLIPDLPQQTLTVRLHHLTQRVHDDVIRHLCDELNATETQFPGTGLKLICSKVVGPSEDARAEDRRQGGYFTTIAD